MSENIKAIDVRNGKLLMPLFSGSIREIDIEKLEELLDCDVSSKVNEVILSISQITCELIRSYSDVIDIRKIQDIFPSSDSLWVLGLISDTFKENY